MWKLTIKKTIKEYFSHFKSDSLCLAAWLLSTMFLLVIILPVGVIMNDGYYKGLNSFELMSTFRGSRLAIVTSMSLLMLSTGMTAFFIREKPIELPKMLFLIPADIKTRMSYLWQRFFLKLFYMLGVLMVYHFIMLGGFFYKKALIDIVVQLGVFIFTIWSLILKTGILGINPGSSLEESRTLKDALINFYWIFFLLLQQILLGIGYLTHIYEKYPAVWLLWLALLGIDGAIAKGCTPEILHKAASYEQVYTKADARAK